MKKLIDKPMEKSFSPDGPQNTHFVAAKSGRRSSNIFVVVLLLLTLYDVGLLLGFVPLAGVELLILQFPLLESLFLNEVFSSTVGLLLQQVLYFAPVYLLLWAWLRFYEKRPFSSLGLKINSAALGQHLQGILVALMMVGAWVAIQAASGHLAFEGWMDLGPVGLAGFAAILSAAYLGRAFQIGIEEALFRGWALQAIGVRYGAFAGILLSSVFFSFFHFFHIMTLFGIGELHDPWPPILAVNILLWAVFAALWVLYEGSLWGVIAFHAAALWSYDYVFGFGGSPSLLDLRLVDPSYLTGGVGHAAAFEG
ncbi:MAG: CPBP family intramembrane glutamic endopeptidase, partial [Rubrobacteraceae bacterium]